MSLAARTPAILSVARMAARTGEDTRWWGAGRGGSPAPKDSCVAPSRRARTARASLAWGLGSGLLYGGWAFAANLDRTTAAAWSAGATQFALSGGATFVLTWGMQAILGRGSSAWHKVAAAAFPLNALAAVFALTHWLAGTPHVARTIAPSYLFGMLFCVAFVARKSRRAARELDPRATGAGATP